MCIVKLAGVYVSKRIGCRIHFVAGHFRTLVPLWVLALLKTDENRKGFWPVDSAFHSDAHPDKKASEFQDSMKKRKTITPDDDNNSFDKQKLAQHGTAQRLQHTPLTSALTRFNPCCLIATEDSITEQFLKHIISGKWLLADSIIRR
jgi:hypothetical protein